jgi:hypothetical protein
MPHTRIWDETAPANSQAIAQGAQRIREMKVDITERMAIDHVWDESVNTDGRHKQVTMLELGADPAAPAANYGVVYTKDVTGTTHLFFRANDGTVRQITGAISNTTLPWASLTGVPAFVAFLEGEVDPGVNSYLIWDDTAGDFAFLTIPLASSYGGNVDSAGVDVGLPTGWTSSFASPTYTVTHNLGFASGEDYSVAGTAIGVGGHINFQLEAKNANTFTYRMFNDENGNVAAAASFALTRVL